MPRSDSDSPRDRRRKERYKSRDPSRSPSRDRKDSRDRDRRRRRDSPYSRRRSISPDRRKTSYDRSPTSYHSTSSHRSKRRSSSRHRSRSDHKKSRHRRNRSSSESSTSSSSSSPSPRSKSRSKKRSSSPEVVTVNNEPVAAPSFNLESSTNEEKRKLLIDEIDADSFVPKTFTSTKKVPDKVIIDLQKDTISVPLVEKTAPDEDEIIHPNFLGNDEERMERWIRKLFIYRQKHSDE
ncbi:unnamed protein product [Hermetia illucens]|uniref:Uncharacterized protein n=1 Tax=Hermetia illucens TaxID=343691 RepID=A0A7R8Z173_HERIL|nr:probable splicing factor, arginine/serine-rich 7 [Hermetia illucens]CAD7089506.1 unnamed protein product [Hermetia illucens]